MPNVSTLSNNSKLNLTQSKPTPLLDTLAQLSTKVLQRPLTKGSDEQKSSAKLTLQKRAKSKAFTQSYLFDLIDLKSNLNKSYWQTYHCAKVVLQEGDKITSRYCNQRWCLTCNRIRTAKMINGYKGELEKIRVCSVCYINIPKRKG